MTLSAGTGERLLEPKHLAAAGRTQLLQTLEQVGETKNEWVRRQVLKNGRVDILAEYVLGYYVAPKLHRRIIKHQQKHKSSLTLCYRGAGKTTVGTIARAIYYVLLDRDVRILIASKTAQNASDFLKEIKQHFESNERLREIFGDYVGTARWDNTSIEVSGRSRPMKEPTIMTLGLEGAVASKHYDVIIADDLVDEENSRTPYLREKLLNWYYKMLSPCLQPPHKDFPYRGSFHHSGTRFHPEDLYAHLTEGSADGSGGQLKGCALVIPALDKDGQSPWPEKHPPEWFAEKRQRYGVLRFNSQYQCNTDAMKGRIFRYDDCLTLDAKAWPKDDKIVNYMGIDLAIGSEEQHDMFAIVIIGRSADGIYVQDYFEGQLRFKEQTDKILKMAKKWKVTRAKIETNAYQKAQYQEVKRRNPWFNIFPHTTIKDKVTRAWKLAAKFEAKKVFFKTTQHHLIEHLVLFPDAMLKDLFDAFDLAVTASERAGRNTRRTEPGLI